MKSAFLPVRYTVLLLDAQDRLVTGLSSLHDLAKTQRVARSALRLEGRASFADIYDFVRDESVAMLKGKQSLIRVSLDDEDGDDD